MDSIPTIQLANDHTAIETLLEIQRNDPKKKKLRSKEFVIDDGKMTWRSWTMREQIYKKKNNGLSTQARGLFTTTVGSQHVVAVRGYDKFFNVLEVESTQWPDLMSKTRGPYEVTAKENGCIIFITALSKTKLVVTSKHSLPDPQDDPTAHGGVGYRWMIKHLESVSKTEADLASWIYDKKLTLVAELCDDQFEEHVLAYNEKESGLYLHGINYNTTLLHTLPSATVQQVAEHFGFHRTEFVKLETMEQVRKLSDEIEETGEFQGRPIEGVVIRCKRDEKDFFFKIKNDHYLLFREYREITKALLDVDKDTNQVSVKADVKPRCEYEKSIYYVSWVRERIVDHPEWFQDYKKNKGIIDVRERFERFWQTADLKQLKGDPVCGIAQAKR
ncbi:RNA ligase-domain-containing protein [Zychaea mexicana]|uniref:RNA ligase-domain-containing protein n=1 Tax=Zychaea mexicana TaxID=64656 RepID=UPI0022FEF972|nr:RNA ligase-domain-containing protein [Zychaea mexicana]KAI9491100.1 RNA ligase-domain-containing protein [Zychaea mexicana]